MKSNLPKPGLLFVNPTGVQPEQQMELFRILSGVLHLGNVRVQSSGRSSDRSFIEVTEVLPLPMVLTSVMVQVFCCHLRWRTALWPSSPSF